MRSGIFLLIAAMLFLSGCSSQGDPWANRNQTTCSAMKTCREYCAAQPLPRCDGEWISHGNYPACVCEFTCKKTNVTIRPGAGANETAGNSAGEAGAGASLPPG